MERGYSSIFAKDVIRPKPGLGVQLSPLPLIHPNVPRQATLTPNQSGRVRFPGDVLFGLIVQQNRTLDYESRNRGLNPLRPIL